jgi:hypothetical protein
LYHSRAIVKSPLLAVGLLAFTAVQPWGGLNPPAQAQTRSRAQALPGGARQLVLWAWDTPNDMSFLASTKSLAGTNLSIAAYVGTITIQGTHFEIKKFNKHLIIPDSVPSFPVIRIESHRGLPDNQILDSLTSAIAAMQNDYPGPNYKIQIDYDASLSERPFYRALLRSLKAKLKPGTTLSVTALASWCLDDRWLTREDCDEAVAMLFSMGPGQASYFRLLTKSHGKLSAGVGLATAVAISASEASTNLRLKNTAVFDDWKKVYIFDSLPWKVDTLTRITRQTLTCEI